MKSIPVKCPRCGSPQKFGVQVNIEDNEIEKFVRCSVCRWKRVIEKGDYDSIKQSTRKRKAKARRRI